MSANTGFADAIMPDICFMSASEQIELTPEQQRFADECGALLRARCRDNTAVCLYSESSDKTIRWIVDRGGHLLEHKEFARV
jgi:hypothetical protein